jgi:hypothetical protein
MKQPRIIVPIGPAPRWPRIKEEMREWAITGLPFLAIAALLAALFFHII